MRYGRLIAATSLISLLALASRPGVAQTANAGSTASVSELRYDVTFDSGTAESRHIHVTMSFRIAGSEAVLLSLPAWTPGSYELDNFARFIRNFAARSGDRALRWDKTDGDTWRVHLEGESAVEVSFDYRADTQDVGMAWTAPDFAFFNGTNLFFYPEEHGLELPARVVFHTDDGWRIATGLTAAAEPGEFTASDYHELVDMPTLIGRFDLDSLQIEGRWYRLATYPVGALAGEMREDLWEQTRRMMPPMSAVFGETPWDTYTTMAVFDDDYPGASALEHRNSHLGVYVTQAIGSPFLPSVLAHEIFHAWNVKRLRPTEMVPYDYGRAQPTTLLWVSEGITDYYADLAMVRGGNWGPEHFYRATADKMGTVANSRPVALEDASLSTWIAPADGTAYLYYPKGSLAGFMLDVVIRDASDNTRSLDDVMRELYDGTYKAGEGFSEAQWWAAVRRAAGGRSFEEFHARFIDGRDAYPWEEILPLAGLEHAIDSVFAPRIGVSLTQDSGGTRVTQVTPGSAAAAAGVAPDDYLLRVGEVDVDNPDWADAFRAHYAQAREGTPYEIVVRRGAEMLTLQTHMRFAPRVSRELREDSNASPKAVRIRQGLLTGVVGR
jgi:predicted metalloprotease with PDZ domain